jgi:chorismate mutase
MSNQPVNDLATEQNHLRELIAIQDGGLDDPSNATALSDQIDRAKQRIADIMKHSADQ